eukprot:TRINITY_DN45107_c0_g1_i1.p2 TRINITY_DN45107_c0_g1~~TRINITY_DN45107_c0_g1_i1.p2  ORF type:complete len:351 (-),score=34.73 TRINITY_DN45107_c0_g1_i1:307-1359(-)
MHNMRLLVLLLFFAAVTGAVHKAIPLREVSLLTFRKGLQTTARRSTPIPQISCEGSACNTPHEPPVVNCQNIGIDDHGIVSWRCVADIDARVSMGDIDVNCEGYDHPDDDRILAGSCGLRYSLRFRDAGETGPGRAYGAGQYGSNPAGQFYHGSAAHAGSSHGDPGDGGYAYDPSGHAFGGGRRASIGTMLVVLVIAAGLAIMCCGGHQTYPAADTDEGRPRPHDDGGYGGGGGGYGGGGGGGFGGGYGGAPPDCTGGRRSGGWFGSGYGGPGWGGAAGAGLLGYMLGSRGRSSYGYQRGYGSAPGYQPSSWSSGGGAWGGGGSSSSGRSGTGGSANVRSATAFGGTSRR